MDAFLPFVSTNALMAHDPLHPDYLDVVDPMIYPPNEQAACDFCSLPIIASLHQVRNLRFHEACVADFLHREVDRIRGDPDIQEMEDMLQSLASSEDEDATPLQHIPRPVAYRLSVFTDMMAVRSRREFSPITPGIYRHRYWKHRVFAEMEALRGQWSRQDKPALLRNYYRVGELLHNQELHLLNGASNTARLSKINRRKLLAKFRQALGGLTDDYRFHFKVARRTHALFTVRGNDQLECIIHTTPTDLYDLFDGEMHDVFTLAYDQGQYRGTYDYSFDLELRR
jgi:hypothetical protein